MLLKMKVRNKIIFGVISAGIILPALVRAVLWESGQSLHLYFRTDLRFDGLMWGALLAWLVLAGYRLNGKVLPACAAITGALSLIVMAQYDLLSNGQLYLWGFSAVGLSSTLLIAGAIWSSSNAIVVRCLSFRPLCWVGKVSYGLYLWHWPVFLAFHDLELGHPVFKMFIEFLTIGIIAAVSFYLFEQHFLKLKKHFHPNKTSTLQLEPKRAITTTSR